MLDDPLAQTPIVEFSSLHPSTMCHSLPSIMRYDIASKGLHWSEGNSCGAIQTSDTVSRVKACQVLFINLPVGPRPQRASDCIPYSADYSRFTYDSCLHWTFHRCRDAIHLAVTNLSGSVYEDHGVSRSCAAASSLCINICCCSLLFSFPHKPQQKITEVLKRPLYQTQFTYYNYWLNSVLQRLAVVLES